MMSVTPDPSMSASRMRRWVELVRPVEPRRVVHRHLRAEPPVAEVRPVADLAVADANQIGQAVARHVGEKQRLGAVAEHARAGRVLFVQPGGPLARTKTFFSGTGTR